MNSNYKNILLHIKKAGLLAKDLQEDLDIHKKEDGVDISTQVDEKVEELIHKNVKEIFPEDGFWGEESDELRSDAEYVWYVDPIDGTKFFAAGIPLWSVSIARVKKGEKIPEFSCIYIPKEDSLFYAVKGVGAWKDNQKLEVKEPKSLDKLMLAFDFVPTEDFKLNSNIYNKIPILLENFYRVRLFGCGSLSTCWTATGFFGCFIKYLQGTKQYNDVAAGLLICKEAGLNVDYQTLENGLERIIICDKSLLNKVERCLR